MKVASAVEKFKREVDKTKLAMSTKRSKVTTFIAQQHSRQEFKPLIGKRVDNIHVDPLHVKNNACAYTHRFFLDELLNQCSRDVTGTSLFANLPPNSKFVKYVHALKNKCNLTRLAKKVIKWFDDTNGTGNDSFDYRFTGKDSRLFLHNFMYLIEVIEAGTDGKLYQQRIYALALTCLYLRDAVSLFCRIKIDSEEVSKLKELCRLFFRGNHVFYSTNPTVWTIGFVVPSHAEDMLGKYGLGLGLNSMEGREAKHISISKYANNTFYNARWEQIFRHEYISLIWLRERGYNLSGKLRPQLPYVPDRVKLSSHCVCGFSKEESEALCRFCCHPMREKVMVSLNNGRWTD